MLSLFPELLFLSPLSAFVIRLAAASVIGYMSQGHLQSPFTVDRARGVLEGVCAVLFFLGLYTQGAAILGVIIAGVPILHRQENTLPRSTLFLIIVLCLSLLVTGPGPFTVTVGSTVFPLSFDLPL